MADACFIAQPSNQEIEMDAETQVAVCAADPRLLRRAIENIVNNAVHYSGEAALINVRLFQSGSRWRIDIEDQGPGVDPVDLELIFRPFFRSGRGRGAAHQGHGVGLALASRIIEAHGGTIRATNRQEGGLRISIELLGET